MLGRDADEQSRSTISGSSGLGIINSTEDSDSERSENITTPNVAKLPELLRKA